MGMIFEDLEDHEGCAVRRLPDGTLTSTWTRDTAAFDAYIGACSCGWNASDHHPPTEADCTAVPSRITELADNLCEEIAELAHDRPLAGRTVAQRLTAWSDHIRQLTKTAERHRLDTVGRAGPERGLSV
jgi:hypothetical protein